MPSVKRILSVLDLAPTRAPYFNLPIPSPTRPSSSQPPVAKFCYGNGFCAGSESLDEEVGGSRDAVVYSLRRNPQVVPLCWGRASPTLFFLFLSLSVRTYPSDHTTAIWSTSRLPPLRPEATL